MVHQSALSVISSGLVIESYLFKRVVMHFQDLASVRVLTSLTLKPSRFDFVIPPLATIHSPLNWRQEYGVQSRLKLLVDKFDNLDNV